MIYIKLLLTAIFWGGTFIAGKFISETVHPVSAAFLRFAIAASCLSFLVFYREGRLPPLQRRQILPVILLGATGVFSYNILFFSGLKYIAAGRASLIIATNPIFISLLSAVVFKERLNWIRGVGIFLSVAGAMIVISNGQVAEITGYRIGLGEWLIFGCVLSWVLYSLIGKAAMAKLSALAAVTYSAMVGAIMLMVPAFYFGLVDDIGGYTALDWSSLAYLGCFGTVLGFYWYYQGIERLGAMKASVFINFVPISALILSHLILNEPVTASLLLGGAMVIGGVCFTNASNMIRQSLVKWRR